MQSKVWETCRHVTRRLSRDSPAPHSSGSASALAESTRSTRRFLATSRRVLALRCSPCSMCCVLTPPCPKVLHIRGCRACVFVVPCQVVLAKLFVEDCEGCTLALHGRLLTGHLEVWACRDVLLEVHAPLGTLQADLCTRLTVRYSAPEHLLALVHAGVTALLCSVGEHSAAVDLAAGDASGDATVQRITRWVGGALLTETVIRDATNYPTTARELLASAGHVDGHAGGEACASEAAQDPQVTKRLQVELSARRGALLREEGNAAFRGGDWAGAAVKYTASLEAVATAAAHSNRAAAFLKLGRHQQALRDCDAALAMDGGNAKARFRRGVALHALHRYQEAGVQLSAALAEDPGNPQVKDALGMTQFAMERERRRAQEER